MAVEQVEWCELPEELLLLILKRLPLLGYLRAGAVCTAWRLVASKKLCPPAPQLPWLLLHDNYSPALNFFSLSPKKHYKLDMPQFSYPRKSWIGSCSGWLMIMYENCEIYLINPVSKSVVRLPPATKLPKLWEVGYWDINGRFCYTTKPMHKAVLLPPINGGDYTILGIYGVCSRLAYCKCGCKKWVELENVGKFYTDVIYFNGKFYGVGLKGSVISCDLSGAFPKVEKIAPLTGIYGWKFLVESQGDLLLVVRIIDHMGQPYTSCFTYLDHRYINVNFSVFKLDEGETQWVRVKSLGGRALFLGLSGSMSLSALEFPECKANCIYFADENSRLSYKSANWSKDLGIYHLEDGSVEPYYQKRFPFKSSPPCIWFRPNPW